jgi:hypothetical protein
LRASSSLEKFEYENEDDDENDWRERTIERSGRNEDEL